MTGTAVGSSPRACGAAAARTARRRVPPFREARQRPGWLDGATPLTARVQVGVWDGAATGLPPGGAARRRGWLGGTAGFPSSSGLQTARCSGVGAPPARKQRPRGPLRSSSASRRVRGPGSGLVLSADLSPMVSGLPSVVPSRSAIRRGSLFRGRPIR